MSVIILFGTGTASASAEVPASDDGLDITNDNATLVPSNYEMCDRTNFRQRVGKLKEEWTGAKIRAKSWEPRNAQDFVRGVPEQLEGSPRPEQEDKFIDEKFPNGVSLTDLDP